MINNKTSSKAKYIKAWLSHIDSLYLLVLTSDKELSEDVKTTLEHLKTLVVRVADTKKLK